MALITVEAVPAGSEPPAAVSVRIVTGERHDFGAAASLSTMASFLQQGRAGAGQTHQVGIDLGRRAIPTHHSICCSVL